MEVIDCRVGESGGGALGRVVATWRAASRRVALTGAGISVDSGIPDFRSPGGLWTRFPPDTYATLACFERHPERSWELFRALGRTLLGKAPNAGHAALASLERAGWIEGIVTQNVDGLHQAAGSRRVLELHGDHRQLQCLGCGRLEPATPGCLEPGPVPRCAECGYPLKPNVVLFGEAVRALAEVDALLDGCDLLLVVGTSAEVAPASLLPERVLAAGGSIVEANRERTLLTRGGLGPRGVLLLGSSSATLPLLARALEADPG